MAHSRSVDGHPLLIKQLKGEEVVETIDLSYKQLGVASATIIAGCLTSNTVTTSLKCAVLVAPPSVATTLAAPNMPN